MPFPSNCRNMLDRSYKLYLRPHLDYGDIIYHNQRVDLIALIVSGCWQGIIRERLYEDLGWESLSERMWARRLTTFYNIKMVSHLLTYLIIYPNIVK